MGSVVRRMRRDIVRRRVNDQTVGMRKRVGSLGRFRRFKFAQDWKNAKTVKYDAAHVENEDTSFIRRVLGR